MQSINKTSKKNRLMLKMEKKSKWLFQNKTKQNENLHRFETDCVEMEKNGVRIRTNNSFESKKSKISKKKMKRSDMRWYAMFSWKKKFIFNFVIYKSKLFV